MNGIPEGYEIDRIKYPLSQLIPPDDYMIYDGAYSWAINPKYLKKKDTVKDHWGSIVVVSKTVYENQRTLLGRYELCLTDIAAASNHQELCAAILKHKDVFGEVWNNG